MTRHLRQVIAITALLYACVLFAPLALADTATLTWTAPTQDTAGRPLAANAITKYVVAWSWSAIPASAAQGAPGVTFIDVTGATQQVVQVTVPVAGGTFHARVKACAGTACSDFSAEATKVFAPVPVVPGIPTNVVIEFR
jgi:hypothetical protein